MKNLVLCVILFFLFHNSHSQNQVTAEVTKFENNQGICQACIFRTAASFEKMEPLLCVTSLIKDKKSEISFSGLADGTYAIFVFHDENANKKMDKNFLGIPKEGYGASSNKLPFAAAPKFSENKFVLSGNTTMKLNIRLRNL